MAFACVLFLKEECDGCMECGKKEEREDGTQEAWR